MAKIPKKGITAKVLDSSSNLVQVNFVGTRGKVLAIINALESHPTTIGQEVLESLKEATSDMGIWERSSWEPIGDKSPSLKGA